MQQSTNYNMNKPDLTDQYDLAHWNQNTDIIDTELKKREDDDTALKNPIYTEASADAPLVSGESFTTAFGKIAKAISSFITHKATTTSVHGSTSNATANKIIERDANGRAKIATASLLDEIPKYKQIFDEKLYERYLAVKVVALTNITLSGEQIIDGVNCVVGDLVLAPVQTTQTQNGVYKVETGSWTRLSDYNTKDLINRTYFGALNGTKKGRLYKANVDSYTEGTTILNYIDSVYFIHPSAQEYWRNKIDACREYRPPIGIPTLWMAGKPNWAIDFGNGASTKYTWANYPNLNNAQFKAILKQLSDRQWMTAYDNEGFYVPDLRGMVPIGYGSNAVRTDESGHEGGGNPGVYWSSRNKYHNHDRGNMRISGGTFRLRPDVTVFGDSAAATGMFKITRTNSEAKLATTSPNGTGYIFAFDTDYNTSNWTGATGTNGSSTEEASKPATIACMWIVRFE